MTFSGPEETPMEYDDRRRQTERMANAENAKLKAKIRQMTGFLATLTVEQRDAALAYRGDETLPTPEISGPILTNTADKDRF